MHRGSFRPVLRVRSAPYHPTEALSIYHQLDGDRADDRLRPRPFFTCFLGAMEIEPMRESVGKSMARALFYRECLPSWLTDVQLRSGNFLLLLGDEPREIPHLDALGVPRDHVWSVERDRAIFHRQLAQELGVSLYCGDMVEYLRHLLHMNQGFAVLNLDIEGSYLMNLDPAMTPVLLFCWRNPETVVATYSSIGRDTEMLWEGIKSLALFRWLAPTLTSELVATLCARYASTGFTEPLRMTLRDLFWLRSQLEHTAIASALVQVTSGRSVDRLLAAGDALWSSIIAHAGRAPLRLRGLEDAVAAVTQGEQFTHEIVGGALPVLGVALAAQQHVIYRAERPWSHRCYFTKYAARPAPVACREWAHEALAEFLAAPLTFIDRDRRRTDVILGGDSSTRDPAMILWPSAAALRQYRPRQPDRMSDALYLEDLRGTLRSLGERLREVPQPVTTRPQMPNMGEEENQTMATSRRNRSATRRTNGTPLVDGGKLTDAGKTLVRTLAICGDDTNAIMAQLPSRCRGNEALRRSVTAYIAIARR